MEIPLLPLPAVLFPGGPLSLRIVEPRYLRMVGDCFREEQGFAVVLDENPGSHPGPATDLATLVRIVDFDRLADGILGITCLGEACLAISATRVQDDGLWLGEVTARLEEPYLALPTHYAMLATVLQTLLHREEMANYARWLNPDRRDAAWVGYRLSEMLPLPLQTKQTLLALTDPLERLDVLYAILHDGAND